MTNSNNSRESTSRAPDVVDRLARFVCNDCGRDWKQYTHAEKDVPCIQCGSDNIEERTIAGETTRSNRAGDERDVDTEGDVVTQVALRADGQEIQKQYTNCSPMTLADETGVYKLIKVGDVPQSTDEDGDC